MSGLVGRVISPVTTHTFFRSPYALGGKLAIVKACEIQGFAKNLALPLSPATLLKRALTKGGRMTLRMRVHDKEPIGLALRRFKKLIERSGMQKELRAHQHYEKPSELRRRARLRKEKAARKAREKTP